MDMTEQFLMEQSPQYDNFWGSLMQGKMPQRTDNKPAAAPTPPPQQQASLMQTAMQPEVQQAAAQALGPEKYKQLEQQGAQAGMQQIQQNPQLVPQQQVPAAPQQGARPVANNNWYDQILYTPSSITAYNDRIADDQDKWDNTAAANKFANTMDPNSPYAKFANMPGEIGKKARALHMESLKKDKAPTSVSEYTFAKDNGYTGTYPQFLKTVKKNGGVVVNNNIGGKPTPMKLSENKMVEVKDKDGNWVAPPLNATRDDVAGGRLKPTIAPGDSGKYMMLKTAQEEIPALKDLLMPGGVVNRETLRGTTLENVHPWVGTAARYAGLSNPQSQQLTTILERGMQGITRTETGAAMPSDEIANTKARFMPSSSDSDESIQRKILAYEYFINNAVDLMNPQGLRNRNLTPEMATAIMGDAVNKAFAESGKSLGKITETGREALAKPTYEDPEKEAAWIKYQKDNM